MDLRRSARSADNLRASFSSVPDAAADAADAAAAERGVKEEEEQVNNKNGLIPTSSFAAKRPVKKLNLKYVPSDATTVAAKPLTEAERSEKKKKKKKNYDVQVPKRLWTEQGEIELLKGLDDFAKEGNSITDCSGFYEFMKGSITEDISLEQVRTKIRHVRDRFRKYETEEKNGSVLSFSKPHLEKCHELSKIIWGAEPEDGDYETVRVDDSAVLKRKNRKTRKSGTAAGVSEEEQEESVQVEDVVEKLKEKDGEGDSPTRKRKNKKRKASSAASVSGEEQEESAQENDAAKKLKATVDKEKDGEGEAVGVHQKSKKKRKASSAEEEQEESVQVDDVAKKLKATVDKEKDGEGEALGVHQKSKKKLKAGNAAGVLKKQQESVQLNDVAEKTKAMFDRQLEGFGFYEFIQGKEQMVKAPLGLESFLNQKAFQTIDPSKMMELEKKWKNVQISEIEMFLERINLVRDYSVMVLEALKSPTS